MTKLSKGDKGITNTLNKKNLKKSSNIIKTLSSLDEAVCFTGLLRNKSKSNALKKKLYDIQVQIMTASAVLAGDKKSVMILKKYVSDLSKNISFLENRLPKRQTFAVPGKNERDSLYNIVRAKVRTAETFCIDTECRPVVNQFLNKLSKYVYLLGRSTS